MSQEPEKAAQDPAKAQPGTEKRHKRPSVMLYLVILFAAAFLLMAWSYVIQQRANHETMSDLEESSSALENVIQENEDLKEQVADLQAQLEQAQTDATQAQEQLADSEALVDALDSLNHLRGLYNQGQYTACRTRLASIDAAQVEATLRTYVEQNTDAAWLEVYNPLEAWLNLIEWLG